MGRKSGVWERRGRGWFTKIRGRQIKLEATTKEEALAALARLSRPHEPVARGATSLTVAELGRRYLDSARRRVGEYTHSIYTFAIGAFVEHSGHLPADAIRGHHVAAWLESRAWNRSSRATYGGQVRVMFRWATDLELVPTYHLARLRLPATRRREPATEDQVATFRAAITAPELADWFDLAVSCGARPGELRTLEARSVAPDRRSASVTGKTGKRTIYFPGALRPILDRLCAARPDGPILRGRGGVPWQRDGLTTRFARHATRCGVHIVAYHLRGIFASRCYAAGVDHLTVAGLLGHKDKSVLARHYLVIRPDMLMAAVDRAWESVHPVPAS